QGRLVAGAVAVLIFAALAFTAYNTQWSSMDEITDPVAVAALTEGFVEVGIGDDIVIESPGFVDDEQVVIENGGAFTDSTASIGVLLVREYMLAFEIIGLLLVASLIGGLLLMRDPRTTDEPEKGSASV
ncbi:MAG: NADH-quinone oxidoreductase subunit J, partial [Dehalococcoidia bacterium]|nr:NADH-quinone oxidoreductase subunit J [Dehalococcoidia bacterium]